MWVQIRIFVVIVNRFVGSEVFGYYPEGRQGLMLSLVCLLTYQQK